MTEVLYAAPAALGAALAVGWLVHVFVRMSGPPAVLAPMVLAAILDDRRDRALALCGAAPAAPFCRAATAVLVAEQGMTGGDIRRRLRAVAGAALATERRRLSVAAVLQAYSVALLGLSLIDAMRLWRGVGWVGGLAIVGFTAWYGVNRMLERVERAAEQECAKLVDALARPGPDGGDADAP